MLLAFVPRDKGGSKYEVLTDIKDPHIDDKQLEDSGVNVYFGAIPRVAGQPHTVTEATFVWLDRDVDEDKGIAAITSDSLLSVLYPPATALVATGHGHHVYWALQNRVPADKAVALVELARVVYKGDPIVKDKQRCLRVPNSWNAKVKKSPVECKLVHLEEVYYEVDELQDMLTAACVATVWTPHARQYMAMALGGLLARANYDVGRAAKLVRAICTITGDEEPEDRVGAVVRSVNRQEQGENNSSSMLREALGPESYKILTTALGLHQDDGKLVYAGVSFGSTKTIQRDLTNLALEQKDWAVQYGILHQWTGSHWQLSNTNALRGYVRRLICSVTQIQSGDDFVLDVTQRLVADVASMVLEDLSLEPMVSVETTLIPVKNGMVDANTGELLPHNKDWGNTFVLDVEYDPEATCPTWEKFLDFAVASPNGEMRAFLQDWMGYLLMGDNPWQKMLWVYGRSGTGKSTFLSVIQRMFGEAHMAFSPYDIDRFEVARLAGKRVATCSELELSRLKTAKLKAMISGDIINSRHMYAQGFDFRFTGKFVWGSNGLPPVDETDGYYRRLDIVPFPNVPEEKDTLLSKKLEAEIPGIFNWALIGWKHQQTYLEQRHWDTPVEVEQAKIEYEEDTNNVAAWASERLVFDPDDWVPAFSIYNSYRNWCSERYIQALPAQHKWGHELRKLGLTKSKRNDKTGPISIWIGCRVRTEKSGEAMSELRAERAAEEAA